MDYESVIWLREHQKVCIGPGCKECDYDARMREYEAWDRDLDKEEKQLRGMMTGKFNRGRRPEEKR